MDYKYIEQLLESYFDCRTTLQEEQILRSFFSQEDVPGHLAEYADLFNYEVEAREEALDEHFDERVLAQIKQSDKPKARSIRMRTRHFAPFFKAAAVVAIALTIGNAAEHAIGEHAAEEDNVMAIDPYTKASDVQQVIRVKDMSQQAKTQTKNDSIIGITTQDERQ